MFQFCRIDKSLHFIRYITCISCKEFMNTASSFLLLVLIILIWNKPNVITFKHLSWQKINIYMENWYVFSSSKQQNKYFMRSLSSICFGIEHTSVTNLRQYMYIYPLYRISHYNTSNIFNEGLVFFIVFSLKVLLN